MSDDRGDLKQPPSMTWLDKLHRAVKTTAVSIVGPGAALVELMFDGWRSHYEKSFDAWQSGIAERLARLEIEGVPVETLARDPNFLSFFVETGRIAARDLRGEKLRYLLNAISNFPRIDETADMRAILLGFVDELQPAHIRLIEYMINPVNAHLEKFQGTPGGGQNEQQWIAKVLPEFDDTPLFIQVWADLQSRNLAPRDREIFNEPHQPGLQMTGLSRRLIAMIRDPDPEAAPKQ